MVTDKSPNQLKHLSRPLLVLLALSLVIGGIGIFVYHRQSASLEKQALDNLQTVANLKASTIAHSLAEQRIRAAILSRAPIFMDFLRDGIDRASPNDRDRVASFLEDTRSRADLDNLWLMDKAGNPVIAARNGHIDEKILSDATLRAVATGQSVFIDIHRNDSDGSIDLGFAAPILVDTDSGQQALGAIVLDVVAPSFLYPQMVWPVASESGGAMLVRKDGDDVLYLSRFYRTGNIPLRFRQPLSSDVIAARVLRGETNPLVGADFRGVKALAASAAVPGTSWVLIAKMNRDEALAEITHLGIGAGVLIFVVLVASIVLVFFLEQRRRLHAVLTEVAHGRALQAAEMQFRAIFEQAGVGIALIAPDGKWLQVNHRLCDMLGYSESELLAHTVFDITHPDDRPSTHASHRSLMSGEVDEFAMEKRYVRRDGDIVWAAVTVRTVREPGGAFDRFVAVLEDITERKRQEETLKKNEDQLRQLQKMEAIGKLTGGVAHDFNNLLAVIVGNLELTEEALSGRDDLKKLIGTALRATQRGATLTQSLLAFSRQQPLNPTSVSIRKLVNDMIDLLRRTVPEDIDIQVVTGGSLWPCDVDSGQLQNALLNLVVNARDAMPNGGKLTIEMANARLDEAYAAVNADVEPGQYVMLAVSDCGTGMSPEVVARAFEPFFTTKPVGSGTGLGLSMVYGFAKQSGGHVKIYSEVDHGTTVRIYLPRSLASAQDETLYREIKADVTHAGLTVLVVEDDDDVRTLVVALVKSLGYAVLDAAGAGAALTLLRDNPEIVLLLTDVILPGGMNGRELANGALRLRAGIKVLYMSGYTENAIFHHGRLDPDVHLLQKPFTKRDLASKIGKVLGGAALQ